MAKDDGALVERLQRRAALTQQVRQFFTSQGLVEVDTPLLATEVIPEAHIDLLGVTGATSQWLQASPERAMKELLCLGSGPIFQIGKAFRAGDFGSHHRPEFTMVEWYVPGDDMAAGIARLEQLVSATLGAPSCVRTSYAEAFQRALAMDPHAATLDEISAAVETHAPVALGALGGVTDRDEWLNVLLAQCVESTLGIDAPEILYHYPASQSALACVVQDASGNAVAERFELYYRGLELANGYHELTDANELRTRLSAANGRRTASGREALPLPERLLELMQERGMPATTGVALGFDRLLMAVTGAGDIADVL